MIKLSFKPKDVSAHTMIYALVVLIVISGLLSTLLYGLYWNKTAELEYVKEKQLEQHLLSCKSFIGTADFFDQYLNKEFRTVIDEDSVVIRLERWGALALASCKAFNQKVNLTANYLYGAKVKSDTTFDLTDNKSPLALVGSTLLKGKLKIPESGIRFESIGVNYFKGNRSTFTNNYTRSDKQFKVADFRIEPYNNGIPFINKNVINSFDSVPVVLSSTKPVTVQKSYLGKIIIQSKKSVTVSRLARLRHVIVRAPIVTVESGFTGNLQILADSVVIEKGVVLEYPSAILVQTDNRSGSVQIMEDARIGGCVIALHRNLEYPAEVLLAPDSKITGEVVCSGYVEACGTILGQLKTNRLVYRDNHRVYVNYLVDASILPLETHGTTFASQALFNPKELEFIEAL